MSTELHELFDGTLKLYQPKQGYRFSIDSILLADFAGSRVSGSVADLGAGSGVLALLLARRKAVAHLTAIELQEELAAIARKNVLLNKLDGTVTIVQADIRNIRNNFPAGGFDAVVTNPPFYAAGTGRVNPHAQQAAARHELHGTVRDFLGAAAYLLKTGGAFFAVYGAERTVDLLTAMRAHKIEPKELRCVHPKAGEPATMVLVAGVKGAGVALKIIEPLVVYNRNGRYTQELKQIYDALCVSGEK